MNIESWIFPVCVAILVFVEISLIVTLIQLKKEIKRLNNKMEEYFGKLLDKIKGMVELFLASQSGKLKSGSIEVKTANNDFKLDFNGEKK